MLDPCTGKREKGKGRIVVPSPFCVLPYHLTSGELLQKTKTAVAFSGSAGASGHGRSTFEGLDRGRLPPGGHCVGGAALVAARRWFCPPAERGSQRPARDDRHASRGRLVLLRRPRPDAQ